jgi:hypothetical protein
VADLVVFIGLVGLVGAAGIALGMLAARWLGAWEKRRATGVDAAPGSGSAGGVEPREEGGDPVD